MADMSSSSPSLLAQLAGVVILAGGQSSRMGSPKAKLRLPSGEYLLDYHVRHVSQLGVPIMIADNDRGFTVEAVSLDPAPWLLYIKDYRPVISTAENQPSGALAAIAGAIKKLIELGGDLKLITHPQSSHHQLPTNYNKLLASQESTATYQFSVSHASWLMVLSCDSLIMATDLWQALKPALVKTLAHRYSSDGTPQSSVICFSDGNTPYPLLGLYHLSIYSKLVKYLDRGERRVIKFIEPLSQQIPLPIKWRLLANLNTPDDFKRACSQLSF